MGIDSPRSTQTYVRWNADSILAKLAAHQELLRALGVTRIGLFGSYLHNNVRPESDIDLLFTMQDMNYARWMTLWNFLEDQFGVEIDLVPEKDLRDELRSHVLAEVRYVYGV
jgi:hypothetical protein